MCQKLTIRDLDLKGKRALIRVDFNVPIEGEQIADDTRIRASLPTIQYVLDHGGSVVLMSHLGRPSGKADPRYSLAPCAKKLSSLIGRPVKMAKNCHGPETVAMAKQLKSGEIMLLENLRFHPGEEKPESEPTFVSGLADLGDLYINDAFASSHRPHASIVPITQFFPKKAAMGFLLEKEVAYLGSALLNPKRPFCALLGGAKISTKFKVIESLMKKADLLLIGGAMVFTFLKAEGFSVGNSLVEDDFLGVAKELMDVSHQSRSKILLPTDIVIAQEIKPGAECQVVETSKGIPNGWTGVDIGPETIARYSKEIQKASTLFWNGPLGIFECSPFDKGTYTIAHKIAEISTQATTIAGGGETVSAIEQLDLGKHFSHISTGGGASLEFIESGQLPGVQALTNK